MEPLTNMGDPIEQNNNSTPANFEEAHECWLKLGGKNFVSQYVAGPDDLFYQSEYWQIVRTTILKRDQFRCAKCHGTANQVHHLNYRYVGQDHLYSKSLISVCRTCHGLFEYARRVDTLLSKIRSLSAKGYSTVAHTYAQMLKYRDELAVLRAKFYAETPYAKPTLQTEEDERNRREAVKKRDNDYREAALIATAAMNGDESEKAQGVTKLLEYEAGLCEDFLKDALGGHYGWEKEYSEIRQRGYAKYKDIFEDAALKVKEAESRLDFATQKSVGKCPVCGGKVFLRQAGYLCENLEANLNACKFKVRLEILSRHIEPDQVSKLLNDGKTDLLNNFFDKSGKSFSAYLTIASGKVMFELLPGN